jgi:hypothetical protein
MAHGALPERQRPCEYSLETDQSAPTIRGSIFEPMKRDTLYFALSLVWLATLIAVILFALRAVTPRSRRRSTRPSGNPTEPAKTERPRHHGERMAGPRYHTKRPRWLGLETQTARIAAQALTPRCGAEVDARFLLAIRTLRAVGTCPVGQWHIGSGPIALVARETVSINPHLT